MGETLRECLVRVTKRYIFLYAHTDIINGHVFDHEKRYVSYNYR